MSVIKTESTQTEGIKIHLMKEYISANKAVGEKRAHAFGEILLVGQQCERRGLDVHRGQETHLGLCWFKLRAADA